LVHPSGASVPRPIVKNARKERSQDRIWTCMMAFREASSDNFRYPDHYPSPCLAASFHSATWLF
jgi:hypothetical protein